MVRSIYCYDIYVDRGLTIYLRVQSYALSSCTECRTMSASLLTFQTVLPIERSALSEKSKAREEVKELVEKTLTDTPATSYNPPVTKGSACVKLVHDVILDYKKVWLNKQCRYRPAIDNFAQHATRFPGRPQQISKGRRGGLVFYPGITPIGTDFMIIDPLITEGETFIGDVEVDINYYYIVLKECDVVVKPGGKLVTLAISDIR